MEYTSERQRAGDLISVSFAQLRASLEAFSPSIMLRSDYGRQVDVKGGSPLVMEDIRQTIMKPECDGSIKWWEGVVYIMAPQGSNLLKRRDRG